MEEGEHHVEHSLHIIRSAVMTPKTTTPYKHISSLSDLSMLKISQLKKKANLKEQVKKMFKMFLKNP